MTNRSRDDQLDSDGCERTRARAHEYLDGELEQPIVDALRRHIATCRDCECRVNFEASFLRTLSRGCRADLPAEVQERISVILVQWKQGDA